MSIKVCVFVLYRKLPKVTRVFTFGISSPLGLATFDKKTRDVKLLSCSSPLTLGSPWHPVETWLNNVLITIVIPGVSSYQELPYAPQPMTGLYYTAENNQAFNCF